MRGDKKMTRTMGHIQIKYKNRNMPTETKILF